MAGCARADALADQDAILARLNRWTVAFNTRDTAGTCDLFAPDLIATFRGGPDQGRQAVCRRIAHALANPDQSLHNQADVQEVIVSGDLAVVRLVWTQTIVRGAIRHVSREPGIDIFKRQPDGSWSIIRYLAFSADPD